VVLASLSHGGDQQRNQHHSVSARRTEHDGAIAGHDGQGNDGTPFVSFMLRFFFFCVYFFVEYCMKIISFSLADASNCV
jgi:hypothetical protein